jgi:uncharacterized membrane protein YecN with MAPEG domain
MTTALICTSVIGLLIFGLSFWSALRRLRLKAFFAGADEPASFTTKLSRGHGNTAEFGPFLALLFLTATALGGSPWSAAAMIGATLSRVLVVVAFLATAWLDHFSPLKLIGAVGTYVSGFALLVALLVP